MQTNFVTYIQADGQHENNISLPTMWRGGDIINQYHSDNLSHTIFTDTTEPDYYTIPLQCVTICKLYNASSVIPKQVLCSLLLINIRTSKI